MKSFKYINAVTGDYIEDVRLESHPIVMEEQTIEYMDELGKIIQYVEWVPVLDEEGNTILDQQYVDVEVPQGFYWPRWNGTAWIEGGVTPVDTELDLTTDQKLEQMAAQMVVTQSELEAAQEALDFLLMGGM